MGQRVPPNMPTYSRAPTDLREPLPLDDSLTVESEVTGARGGDRTDRFSFPGEHPLYPQVEAHDSRLEGLELTTKVLIWCVMALALGSALLFAVVLGILLALISG